MNRRELLGSAGVVGAVLAGCVTDGPSAPGNDGDDPGGGTSSPDGTDDTDSPQGTDGTGGSTDTPGEPAITDRSFEVTDQGCGTGENAASVTFGDDDVTVVGTISGANACYTAELEEATYDAEADEMTVSVRSHDPTTERACADCIVDIDYETRISFHGGLPGEVEVEHNGELVTTARRDRTTDEDGTATPES